jgi:hypothetical protein
LNDSLRQDGASENVESDFPLWPDQPVFFDEGLIPLDFPLLSQQNLTVTERRLKPLQGANRPRFGGSFPEGAGGGRETSPERGSKDRIEIHQTSFTGEDGKLHVKLVRGRADGGTGVFQLDTEVEQIWDPARPWWTSAVKSRRGEVVCEGDMVPGAPSRDLSFSPSLLKARVYPGEPVLVRVAISNSGAAPLTVRFGEEGVAAFKFFVSDAAGSFVRCREVAPLEGGIYSICGVEAPAGGGATTDVVLNRWCTTLLPEGKYNVHGEIAPEAAFKREEIPWRLPTVKFEMVLEIVKLDEDKLRDTFSSLAAVAFGERPSSDGLSRDDATEMLGLADSPLATEYKTRLLRLTKVPRDYFIREVIGSLARTPDVANAKALMDVYQDPTVSSYHRNKAIVGLYRLRETGDPEVIKATEEFASRNPNPGEMMIGD